MAGVTEGAHESGVTLPVAEEDLTKATRSAGTGQDKPAAGALGTGSGTGPVCGSSDPASGSSGIAEKPQWDLGPVSKPLRKRSRLYMMTGEPPVAGTLGHLREAQGPQASGRQASGEQPR